MKFDPHKLLTIAAAGGASFVFAQSVHAATILTGTGQANNTPVPSDHGSFLPGTPNIAVTWSPVGPDGWEAYGGWTNESALNETGTGVYQMDNAFEDRIFTILLTPDSGFDVILTSIDFNVWNGGGDFNIGWNVSGTNSGTMGSGTFLAPTNQNTTLTFGNLTGSGSEAITLDMTILAGSGIHSYLAADNLAFDQIPETTAAVMGVLGLGAMAMRRRRK